MDINTIIQLVIVIIQSIVAIITLISVILIYKTIKSNESLNQKIILNEVVKQERELRIKLSEYRIEINKRINSKKDFSEISLNYDTLLFNYYEYLAICLYKKIIHEKETQLYFEERLKYVKEIFDSSILFKKDYAQKEQYKGLNWLFKHWKI